MTSLARRALLATPILAAARAARASDWPSRTVRIRAQTDRVVRSPQTAAWMRSVGQDPATDRAPGEFARSLDAEHHHWRRVIAEVAPGLL